MQIDDVSGLNQDKSLCRHVYERAKRESRDVVIAADLFNLGNLNNAADRKLANDVYKLYCSIYIKNLYDLNPSYVYGFRQGGDEVAFIVGDVDMGQVQRAIDRANDEIAQFCEATSLKFLEHPKRPGKGGVGMTAMAVYASDHDDINYDTLSENLQNHLTVMKDDDTDHDVEYGLSPDYFHSDSKRQHLERFIEIYRERFPDFEMSLPDDLDLSGLNKFVTVREKRNEAIQALPDLSAYSLLRVDLMNMGGINDQVGKDVTDQILKHISEGIAAQCDQAGVTYELFPIGGGVYDVVIKSQDQELIDSLKQDIFYKLRREIFDQTVEGYCKAHDLPFMPGADSVRLRDLDDIRGGRQGAGVVITDINLDNSYALESIEARIDLLKLHGIATITQSRNDLSVQRSPLAGIRKIFESWSRKAEETTEEKRAFQILNVTGVQEREVVDDIDPDQDNVFPYARSLRSRLSQQQIENVFAQGSVAVYQTLMGVSMSRGEATDIAHQQNRDTGRKRFKKINGVCEALQGIALIQKYNEAHENDTAFIRLEDSIDYLQKDVDFLRTVNRNMEDGRQIEAISQLANACVHAANITGVSVPPRINHIVASLSYKALLDVADFTRDTGDEHISEVIVNFANTLDEKAGGDISAEGGYFAIFRELERQRMLIEESTALTEDQRQAILSQLSYAEDRSQDGDGLTYYAREELEMMAERHKVWLETEGQKGACLILNKLRIKGAAFMHDFNRAMRGQNAELFYDFTGAELRDSRTTKLDYGNARFKDAIVDNMDFDCSMMDNADFRDVKELRRSSFAFCGIQGTKFTLSEGFLTCRFYSGGIKHGDYSEFDGLEIYMPDGRRVAGFYPDGWGYMHFSPTKRDEQKNAGQNVTADEVKVFVAAAAAAQQENAVSADRDGRKEKPQI